VKSDATSGADGRKGFVLLAVVILVLVLVLLGVGRLAAFRYRAERRLAAQREVELDLCTKSALARLLDNNTEDFAYTGRSQVIEVSIFGDPSPLLDDDFDGGSLSNIWMDVCDSRSECDVVSDRLHAVPGGRRLDRLTRNMRAEVATRDAGYSWVGAPFGCTYAFDIADFAATNGGDYAARMYLVGNHSSTPRTADDANEKNVLLCELEYNSNSNAYALRLYAKLDAVGLPTELAPVATMCGINTNLGEFGFCLDGARARLFRDGYTNFPPVGLPAATPDCFATAHLYVGAMSGDERSCQTNAFSRVRIMATYDYEIRLVWDDGETVHTNRQFVKRNGAVYLLSGDVGGE